MRFDAFAILFLYLLIFLEGASIKGDNQQSIPYIEFHIAEKTFNGKDGCNMISGSIEELSDKSIKFGPIMATKMACMDMTIPDLFHQKMMEVRSYDGQEHVHPGTEKKNEGTLSFYNEEGERILAFTEIN